MNDETPAKDRKVRRKPSRRPTRLPEGDKRLAKAADAAAWQKACNEVTASILSDQVHKTGRLHIDPKVVDKAMRERMARAKKELGEHCHAPGAVGCTCRHLALISVGAVQQSEETGVSVHIIFHGARAVLEAYLERRN